MKLNQVKIGIALTGSHCTLAKTFPEIEKLVREGADVTPIISASVDHTDTRFGAADSWKDKLYHLTGKTIVNSIVTAEPIGPQGLLDVMVIAPCTGNTLAKLANGITDSPVLMAAKAHLRNQRPVVLAISTNDGLGINARNLGVLLNAKHIFMVPFGQDSPVQKPNSLVAKMDLLLPTIIEALKGKQLQPILVGSD